MDEWTDEAVGDKDLSLFMTQELRKYSTKSRHQVLQIWIWFNIKYHV